MRSGSGSAHMLGSVGTLLAGFAVPPPEAAPPSQEIRKSVSHYVAVIPGVSAAAGWLPSPALIGARRDFFSVNVLLVGLYRTITIITPQDADLAKTAVLCSLAPGDCPRVNEKVEIFTQPIASLFLFADFVWDTSPKNLTGSEVLSYGTDLGAGFWYNISSALVRGADVLSGRRSAIGDATVSFRVGRSEMTYFVDGIYGGVKVAGLKTQMGFGFRF